MGRGGLKGFMVLLVVMLLSLPAMAGSYKLGPGDVLDIAVWKNPDLTRKVIVLPDGTIHFPLINEINAQGLSVKELEHQIKSRLAKYLTEPVLTISVSQVNAMMIYVIGKVNQPGRFMIHSNIDVLQALSMAGGLNPFAREKEIAVFRKHDTGTTLFDFNYQEVSQGQRLDQNIMLKPGDVIVVR